MARPPKKPEKPRKKPAARSEGAATRATRSSQRAVSPRPASPGRGVPTPRPAAGEVRDVAPVEDSDESTGEGSEVAEPVETAEPVAEELAELEPVSYTHLRAHET